MEAAKVGPDLRGLLLVVFGLICLSTAPAAVKLGIKAQADPLGLLLFRLWVGLVFLGGWILLVRRQYLKVDRAGLVSCALVGGANTISLLCFYLALLRVDVSVAILIFGLYPAAALLQLLIVGEFPSRISWIRLVLAVLGVYLLVGPGGDVDPTGVVMLLATAFFFALHLNLMHWRLSAHRTTTITVYIIASMAVFMTIAFLIGGRPIPPASIMAWGVIFWTGIVSTALARFLVFAGVKRIGSGQAALLGPFDILFSVLWALLFLGERLFWLQWLGGGLILLSALLVAAERKLHRD